MAAIPPPHPDNGRGGVSDPSDRAAPQEARIFATFPPKFPNSKQSVNNLETVLADPNVPEREEKP
jgi:hypothetical protein